MNDSSLENEEPQLPLFSKRKYRSGETLRKRQEPKQGATKTVGFRADERLRKLLKERAEEMGINVGDFVKRCVDDQLLEDSTRASAYEAFLELRKSIHALRVDVAISTEALLQTAGCLTAAQSEEWVRGNLWKREVKITK